MSSVDSGTTTPVMCANHPKVETGVSCSECGKPICPDCMVPAAVGIKCRECARLPRSARAAMKPDRLVRAVGASLAAGIAMGVVLAFAGGVGLGFFTFVVGYGVGLLAARATVW